ncbi:hypothetical protein Ancab_020303 [Ancistrocladus abbreviatus]
MGLKDIGESLPPGFRFYPSDAELVCHYLQKKIANEEVCRGTLVEIDLHACEPWQLPEVAKLNSNEWYFFSFRDRKYATGFRTNRATTSGYWKATGKDRVIINPMTRETVGMRKTLVFYKNRAPNGIKTGWIMHEFRLESPHMPPKEDWVLCRVFHKCKADNTTSIDSPPHMFDHQTVAGTSSSTSADEHRIMPCGHEQANSLSTNPSTQNYQANHHINQNVLDLALLNTNILQFLKDQGNPNIFNGLVNSKNDETYGLLWDVNMTDSSPGDGVPHDHYDCHDLGDMRFEDENGILLL